MLRRSFAIYICCYCSMLCLMYLHALLYSCLVIWPYWKFLLIFLASVHLSVHAGLIGLETVFPDVLGARCWFIYEYVILGARCWFIYEYVIFGCQVLIYLRVCDFWVSGVDLSTSMSSSVRLYYDYVLHIVNFTILYYLRLCDFWVPGVDLSTSMWFLGARCWFIYKYVIFGCQVLIYLRVCDFWVPGVDLSTSMSSSVMCSTWIISSRFILDFGVDLELWKCCCFSVWS
jgi:hypothetical protein